MTSKHLKQFFGDWWRRVSCIKVMSLVLIESRPWVKGAHLCESAVIRTNAGARSPTYAFRLPDTAWAERNGGEIECGSEKKTLRRGRGVRASQRKKEPRERREAEKALKVCPSSFPVLSRTSSKWANGRSVKSLTLAGGVLRAHICGARAFDSQGPQKTKAFETHLLTPPWPAAPSWDEH